MVSGGFSTVILVVGGLMSALPVCEPPCTILFICVMCSEIYIYGTVMHLGSVVSCHMFKNWHLLDVYKN